MPPTLVARPTLVRTLVDVRGGDLVVVSAPAGYGKTSDVTLWDDADERRFAWLRLDHLDDDPVHLLEHIAFAVDQVQPINHEVLHYDRGPSYALETELMCALVKALEATDPMVVVIDDSDGLTAPTSIDTLREFVDILPATTTAVLVGRGAPPVDVARRRLHGNVLEIGMPELSFDHDEAAAAFAAFGGSTSTAVVEEVVAKCDGWAAGIRLAALALRDGIGVEVFTGQHRLVADYFVEEVLNRLDAATTSFLIESAVLDHLCAAHLDAVLQRDDSAHMLAKIVRLGNIFVIPVEAEQNSYRYHKLFADLLRARLRERDPVRSRVLASRAADLTDQKTRFGPGRSGVMAIDRRRCGLSAAEMRLLPYLATHLSLRQIAAQLSIGRETAKTQAASIYRKFDVSSRSAAVSKADRLGLLRG